MDYEYAELNYDTDWDFYNQSDELEESWIDQINSDYYDFHEDPSEYSYCIEYQSIV